MAVLRFHEAFQQIEHGFGKSFVPLHMFKGERTDNDLAARVVFPFLRFLPGFGSLDLRLDLVAFLYQAVETGGAGIGGRHASMIGGSWGNLKAERYSLIQCPQESR